MNQDCSSRQVTVQLENGLHLVPCSRIAGLASQFAADVRISKDDHEVDAKTILDLMTLSAECGTVLTVSARGTDACEAVAQVAELFDSNFATDNSNVG